MKCARLACSQPATTKLTLRFHGRAKTEELCEEHAEIAFRWGLEDSGFRVLAAYREPLSQKPVCEIQKGASDNDSRIQLHNPTAVGDFADVAERNSTNSMKPTAVAVSGTAHV